jgi:dephospho-CoA kinase
MVGLAGKACAGKDALVPFFRDRGFTVIDADRLGHAALEANRGPILARFGTLDRKALGALVFSDAQALADLEAISHPWIASEVDRLAAAAPGPVLVNAALLHRLPQAARCAVVVWVEAPLLTRILRARRRDRWTWVRILKRIWAQRKLRAQVFPRDVDILRVDNGGALRRSLNVLESRFGPVSGLPEKEEYHEK